MPLSPADQKLLQAVKADNPDLAVIQAALAEGANINCKDDAGLTPLHIAACKNHLDSVRLLLKPDCKRQDGKPIVGAKTHLISIVNGCFETPLQYAMLRNPTVRKAAREEAKADASNTVMGVLIRHRTPVTLEDINDRLGFCLTYYKEDQKHIDENRALLDYAVSHLTGVNIHHLKHHKRNESLIKYDSHIRSIKGEKKDITSGQSHNLEGFSSQASFVPLRIRVFFEILFQVELEIIRPDELPSELPQGKGRVEMRRLLQEELLSELETLHVCQLTKIVTFAPPPAETDLDRIYASGASNILMCSLPAGMQLAMRRCLAWNIVNRLHALHSGQEFTFAGGWSAHAIYIAFIRRGDDIMVRIDNLGDGCGREYSPGWFSFSKPFHPIHENRESKKTPGKSLRYRYPAILGSAPLSDFREGQPLFGYIEGLIGAYKQPNERSEAALAAIYDAGRRLLAPCVAQYPSAKMQSIGNCVVKNHQVGLQIRLGSNGIYKWIRRKEYNGVHLKEEPLAENYRQIYWGLENKPRPVSAAADFLLREHYKSIQFKHLLKREDKPQADSYVPLDLVRQIISKSTLKDSKDSAVPETKNNSFSMGVISDSMPAKQLLTLETLFQRLPNEEETGPLSRMVISGVAGVGKSTISLRIAQEWARGRLWSNEIENLIFIRLRNLSSDRYPLPSRYDLVDVVHKELSDLEKEITGIAGYISRAVIKRWLDDGLRTLCVLDGYDEVADSIPPQLEDAFKQLLASPKLLVTSRPEAVTSLRLALSKPLPSLLPLDAQIELTGFGDGNVKNYVEKFFSAHYTQMVAAKNSNELLAFLKANPVLSALARIPA